MIHYDDEIIFNKLIAKDPNPGEKNRLKKSEDGNFIIVPGWVVDQKEDYIVSTHGTKKFYREFKLNSQVLYDILILGFTNIDQRPLCPVCGNPINFRNNLFGKYAGYYNFGNVKTKNFSSNSYCASYNQYSLGNFNRNVYYRLHIRVTL